MSDISRRPILGRGENLVEPITKNSVGGPKEYPRTYEEAKKLVREELVKVKKDIESIPLEKKMDEVVIAVRLNEKFLAKSYTPNSFFHALNVENVGSRKWVTDSGKESKLNFVKIKPNNIDNGLNLLDSIRTNSFKEDLRKIEEINLLNKNEVALGFDDTWDNGRVELVLHPYEEAETVLEKLFNLLKITKDHRSKIRYKAYEHGPIFVSINLSREELNSLTDFNPLRTVHPMDFELNSVFTDLISNKVNPPVSTFTPVKKVGVIDGGVNIFNPFFQQSTTQNYEVVSLPSDSFMTHGTNVASLILYGDLQNFQEGVAVPSPVIGVESIRVFPTADPSDIDLYESIDLIEEAVPKLGDIDVFNVSVGPKGSILDDDISRFTTALDQLAYDHRKLFIVAVGNSGMSQEPYNRIESPSDMVNGIGVGAYQIDSEGNYLRAPYSSVGLGREGCKVKPDFCEHGGSALYPIQVLGTEDYAMQNVQGTSFAAPIVARKAAELMLKSNDIGALTARSLLTQATSSEINEIDHEFGYGICADNVDDILLCTPNKVTIIYNNEMSVKNYAKLKLPVPQACGAKKIKISWTVVVVTPPNPLFAESYTSTAIEDALHPHEDKFNLYKNSRTIKRDVIDNSQDVKELINDGWKLGSIPASVTPNKFATESERRDDLKWDTVAKRSKVFQRNSLKNPFLSFHALDRDTNKTRVRYSVAVTIEALDYQGDLYQEILNEYPVLQPINVRLEQEIRTSIQGN
ncbi:S8 family peptidase [Sporosarcina sp. Te-1]|uniref:S8 family peptidase n=1 Tax=Sporosarcina sp. Te-1 TaxID=2818390 RepID=UPI001A9D3DA9|nr:S8 family peptidase [Sporosarcina sp. Te-1]QTD42785.1 S8 family peptidase [Sporosarcina sp. Te-1]